MVQGKVTRPKAGDRLATSASKTANEGGIAGEPAGRQTLSRVGKSTVSGTRTGAWARDGG